MVQTSPTIFDGVVRIVVPKAVRRDELGGGRVVDVAAVDGRIEIEFAAAAVSVRHDRGFPRLEALEDVPGLTDDDVRAAIDATRR